MSPNISYTPSGQLGRNAKCNSALWKVTLVTEIDPRFASFCSL